MIIVKTQVSPAQVIDFFCIVIVFHELVKFGLRYFIALHTFKLCFQLTLRISTLAL